MSTRTFLIALLPFAAAVAGIVPPAAGPAATVASSSSDHAAAIGRWDIEVQDPNGTYPSWLEITRSEEGNLNARFVGRVGGARPVTELSIEDGRIRFALPAQFESRADLLRFEGALDRTAMKGETTNDAGDRVTWSAVRAPSLERRVPHGWGRPHALISPGSLTGWRARDGGSPCWQLHEGTLFTTQPCADLVTQRKFRDFKLELEFMITPGSDSGVHLRGRYEIQLKDDEGGMPEQDVAGHTGGVYGFLPPLRNAARKPGEWQTLEATLVGRTLTVVLNGETVIDAQEIPGITGDALDSDEGAAGPIILQGYLGPVAYRNIVITPAQYEL